MEAPTLEYRIAPSSIPEMTMTIRLQRLRNLLEHGRPMVEQHGEPWDTLLAQARWWKTEYPKYRDQWAKAPGQAPKENIKIFDAVAQAMEKAAKWLR